MSETPHMEWATLRNQLMKVISTNAVIPLEDLSVDRNLRNDLHMDSFAMVNTVNAIEQEFSITISDHEMEDLQTIGDVTQLLQDKLSEVVGTPGLGHLND